MIPSVDEGTHAPNRLILRIFVFPLLKTAIPLLKTAIPRQAGATRLKAVFIR